MPSNFSRVLKIHSLNKKIFLKVGSLILSLVLDLGLSSSVLKPGPGNLNLTPTENKQSKFPTIQNLAALHSQNQNQQARFQQENLQNRFQQENLQNRFQQEKLQDRFQQENLQTRFQELQQENLKKRFQQENPNRNYEFLQNQLIPSEQFDINR